MKTPYRNGTRACPVVSVTQVLFEPVDFIARLAALVRIGETGSFKFGFNETAMGIVFPALDNGGQTTIFWTD